MDTYLPMTDQEFYLNAKQIIEKNRDNPEIVKDALAYMYALNFLAFEKNNKWSGPDKNHSSSLPKIEAIKEDVLDSGVIDVSIMIGGVLTCGKDSPSYIDVFDKIKDMSQEELVDHMAHDYGSFDGYFNDSELKMSIVSVPFSKKMACPILSKPFYYKACSSMTLRHQAPA